MGTMSMPPQNGYRVTLVVPPFRSVVRPALGVSLLQAELRQQGVECSTMYANLQFADSIGLHLYETLAGHWDTSVGDFLFSCVVFGHSREEIARYVEEVLLPSGEGRYLKKFPARNHVPQMIEQLARVADAFVEDVAVDITREHPQLVGFTTSFQENLASIAIARRLKQKAPNLLIAIGGANCGGVMGEELLAQFPEFDFVGQGECDRSFIELVAVLASGDGRKPIAGILSRYAESPNPEYRTISGEEFERLPLPDFSDYFSEVDRLRCREQFMVGLVMESSRGCWWGERNRCRFCSLNAEQYEFRSKSPARFHAEMDALTQTYGENRMELVDNIVPPEYFRDVFPAMAERTPVRQFWETSGSLSKEQCHALARSGTTHIQAGMESLSEKSLRLMNKPTTPARNIQTLKWCSESGVTVLWSLLFGVPGEDESEVEEFAQIAESIPHLDPPFSARVIRVQRFSPYFEWTDQYNFGAVIPAACYGHIYPLPQESVERLAYHFDSDLTTAKTSSKAFRRLKKIVGRWRCVHWRSHLIAVNGKRKLIVIDTRPCAKRLLTKLTGAQRRAFELCETAKDRSALSKVVQNEMSETDLDSAIGFLTERRFMICIDGRYLTVALNGPRHRPVNRVPGGHLRPARLRDLWSAWRKRTAFRWVLALFLYDKTPRDAAYVPGRLRARVLAGSVRHLARIVRAFI